MKKRRNMLATGLTALLLVVFLVYIGYQSVQNLSEQIVTVDALVVDVEDKITADGVFLRSQRLVYGDGGKSAQYLVEDGEKVSKGQELAVFFDNSAAADAYRQMVAVEQQIKSLEYAYANLSSGLDSAKTDTLIHMQMADLVKYTGEGNVSSADKAYANLQQLIISRNATVADQEAYQEQLTALRAEKQQYQNQISGSTTTVRAEVSGYFYHNADGYEAVLHTDQLENLTPESILYPQQDTGAFADNVIGTIIDDYEWYYAAVITQEQADLMAKKNSVRVYFPQISSESIKTSVEAVRAFDDGRGIIVLQSDVMDPLYLANRSCMADIVMDEYRGIKVPRQALRQLDGQWGVYCLVGAISRFKPVEWVYQTDSYYLVESAASARDGLYLYDKMIVSAKGLEDDKVMK